MDELSAQYIFSGIGFTVWEGSAADCTRRRIQSFPTRIKQSEIKPHMFYIPTLWIFGSPFLLQQPLSSIQGKFGGIFSPWQDFTPWTVTWKSKENKPFPLQVFFSPYGFLLWLLWICLVLYYSNASFIKEFGSTPFIYYGIIWEALAVGFP